MFPLLSCTLAFLFLPSFLLIVGSLVFNDEYARDIIIKKTFCIDYFLLFVCGGYATVVNWDTALPLVLVQNKTDSVLNTHNLGTHTLTDTVGLPAYMCALRGMGTKLSTLAFAFGLLGRYTMILS